MQVYDKSSVSFVYPFVFDSGTFEGRCNKIDNAKWGTLNVWRRKGGANGLAFADDVLLPYVARYINPAPGEACPTAQWWQVDGNVLHSRSYLGSTEWSLVLKNRQVEFALEAIELVLFRLGVGFIITTVRPIENTAGQSRPSKSRGSSPVVEDWIDFIHYFRFIKGQRGVKVQAVRHAPTDADWFFSESTADPNGLDIRIGEISELIKAFLVTAAEDSKLEEEWWEEVFVSGQMLPFVGLFLDDVEEQEIAPIVYKVRNFFHSRQEIFPSAQDLRLDDNPNIITYADNQWFTFSLEGGAFVACNAPQTTFFRQTLPDHLRLQYFLLFLIAMHQRFALLSLSQQVAEHWPIGIDECESRIDTEQARQESFERIRDLLLSFTARGYFAQVMQKEHHHRCYRKWQEILQIERLYNDVSREVNEMHGYLLMKLQDKQQKKLDAVQCWISHIGIFIGIPALVISFLGIINGLQDGGTVEGFGSRGGQYCCIGHFRVSYNFSMRTAWR